MNVLLKNNEDIKIIGKRRENTSKNIQPYREGIERGYEYI